MDPGHIGQVVGQRVLAQQRLGHPGAEHVRELLDLGAGPAGALADQDRRPSRPR